jgi:hypothetical protein
LLRKEAVSNRRQETRWIKLCNEENHDFFYGQILFCHQFKTGETSGAHCTCREEIKYVKKILVRKPEGIIPILKRGLDKWRINIAINGTGEQARVDRGVERIPLAQATVNKIINMRVS